MKRSAIQGLVLVLFFAAMVPIHSAAIEVCKTCSLQKIQTAIDAARPGDQILIGEGSYLEQLNITKSIRLTGNGLAKIDGGGLGHVIDIKADDVVIENLQITGSGASDRQEFAGIHVFDSRNCRLERNQILANTYGVYLANTEGCQVHKNSIVGNATNEVMAGNGVHLWKTSGVNVSENIVSRHRDGIYIEFSKDMKIEQNHSSYNIRYGLHFMFASENEFRRNIFTRNETGVAIMYSRKIIVEDNIFEYSWGLSAYGMLLKDIMDSDFRRNRFFNNTAAVFADNSNRNRFSNNEFEKNGFALQLLGDCEHNEFNSNDFKANFFDVGFNSKESSNQFTQNYWDQYTGYDINRDGLGDVAYRPVKVFSYWLTRYNPLAVLLLSPALEFLEMSERAFPIFTPINLADSSPSMRPLAKNQSSVP